MDSFLAMGAYVNQMEREHNLKRFYDTEFVSRTMSSWVEGGANASYICSDCNVVIAKIAQDTFKFCHQSDYSLKHNEATYLPGFVLKKLLENFPLSQLPVTEIMLINGPVQPHQEAIMDQIGNKTFNGDTLIEMTNQYCEG